MPRREDSVASIEAPPQPSHQIAILTGIFLVALAIRLAVAYQLGSEPLYRSPQLDSLEYFNWARRLLQDIWWWPARPSHSPGYPYWLAGWLALGHGSFSVLRIAQACVGALTAALGAGIAWRLSGKTAAVIAGLSLALCGPLVWIDTSLLAEGPLLALLAAALAAWMGTGQEMPPTPTRAAAVGALVGLAALMRPTALALLAVFVLSALCAANRRRTALLAAAIAAAVALAVAAPAAVKASRVAGGPVLLQAYSGWAFYLGNRTGATGLPTDRLGADWERLQQPAREKGAATAAAEDAFFRGRALQEILADPAGFLALLGRKAFWLLQAEEIRDSHAYQFFRDRSAVLSLLPGFGWLLPMGVAGIFATRCRREWLPIYLFLALFAGTCLAFMVGTRYRLPLVLPLAILAGQAGATLLASAREKRWRTFATVAAAIAVTTIVSQLGHHAPSRNFAEEWAMTGASLEGENRVSDAEVAYQRARQLDPESLLALEGQGRLALRAGRFGEARTVMERVAARLPESARVQYHLGLACRGLADNACALTAFRQARTLAADYLPAALELGSLWLEHGDANAAATEFTAVLAQDNLIVRAHLGLAKAEGARGRAPQGLASAQRAAELDPTSHEAWFLVAALALDTRDLGLATTAIGKLEALQGVGPQSSFLRVLVLRAAGRSAEATAALGALRERWPGFGPASQL